MVPTGAGLREVCWSLQSRAVWDGCLTIPGRVTVETGSPAVCRCPRRGAERCQRPVVSRTRDHRCAVSAARETRARGGIPRRRATGRSVPAAARLAGAATVLVVLERYIGQLPG